MSKSLLYEENLFGDENLYFAIYKYKDKFMVIDKGKNLDKKILSKEEFKDFYKDEFEKEVLLELTNI